MKAEDLCVFLTTYGLCVAFASVGAWFRGRQPFLLMHVVLALAVVFATTVVGFYLEPGKNYVQLLLFLVSERDFSAVVSVGFGLAAALAWMVALQEQPPAPAESVPGRRMRQVLVQGTLVASLLGVVLCPQAFIWKELRGIQRDPVTRVHASQFTMEKIADLDFLPVRIAVSDAGRVFVTYSYFETWGDMGGAILEISPDAKSGKFHTRVVADSPMLMRCYGLAERNGDLFVSRTGIYSHANKGRLTFESTGAITQLKDLDRDGYFEFADDVVTGLPGARGPDTTHQNNGIAFAPDGSLFITVGSSANRELDRHPWGGTVLRCSPDFSRTEVFAQGFRNPFGMVFGPDGELFVTDNDVDENPGDELNHVVLSAHYGHPYIVPNETLVEGHGFRDPIMLGEHESNLLGMAYATSEALPEEYRNCIYVADFMQNRILKLKLERAGDTYRVTDVRPFVTVSSPVDIAVTASGEFYCISRRTQNVYRIRLKQSLGEK